MHFSVNLTQTQAAFAQTLLPKGYSIQIGVCDSKRQRSAKKLDDSFTADYGLNTKRIGLKNQNPPSNHKLSVKEIEEFMEVQDQLDNKLSKDKRNSTKNIKIENSKKLQQTYPWKELLQKLKSHRCSWPFRLPVDPQGQGVPNYLQIIKQPMDLRTMQQKLKNKAYKSNQQFHADIKRIINNSFVFNPKQSTYYALTQEFQALYLKASEEVNIENIAKKEDPSQKCKQNKVIKQQKKQISQLKQRVSFKKATLGSKLSARERQNIFHRIYQLPQSEIIKLIKILSNDKLGKEWQQFQIDFKEIEDDKFEKIVSLIKQK